MTCTYRTHVLGVEEKISQKTNRPYNTIAFMDGAKPISLMVKEGTDISKIVPFKQMTLTVDVTLGKYMRATIIDVKE